METEIIAWRPLFFHVAVAASHVMEAVRLANVHMDIAMPQWLKNHANVNTQTLSRLRDTDADASRLAEFRHSIKHNRAEDGSEGTGTDDYASMVDKLISKYCT